MFIGLIELLIWFDYLFDLILLLDIIIYFILFYYLT